MQVINNKQVFFVKWQHFNPELLNLIMGKGLTEEEVKEAKKVKGGLNKLLGVKSVPTPRKTACIITDEDGAVILQEEVSRHKNDPHSPEKARTYSLTKALRKLFPTDNDKPVRRLFWEAYLGRQRKVWKTVKVWKDPVVPSAVKVKHLATDGSEGAEDPAELSK